MKKLLSIILMFTLFFSATAIISADSYEYRYAELNDKLFTCKYFNEKNNEEFIIDVGVRGDHYVDGVSVITTVNGATKYNKLLKKDERPANTIGESEITNFLTFHSICPKYAGAYKDKGGYALSDNKDDLSGSDFVLELWRLRYNENYCFYTFTDEYDWGFFAKKKLLNFEQNNTGKECPAKVVAELKVSVEEEIPEVRKYYGTEEEGIALEVTKQKCVVAASDYLKKEYDDPSGTACYVGKLQDTKGFENQINNPNSINPIDNNEIDCNSVFDAETGKMVNGAYFILEILAILIVMGLTIKDYLSAILNSNQDEMKKANKRLITRLIILVVILLLPALIKLIFKIFKIELFASDPFCGTIKK